MFKIFKGDLKYEKKFWEEIAQSFTKHEIKYLKRMQKFIQAWIERFWQIPENLSILEIGGAGRPLINFFKTGKKFCLDPLIDFYEEKFPEFYNDSQLHKIKGEAEDMYYFENNTFELIILLNVLDHTKNPVKVINECYRVLKKDGILVLSVDTFNLFWKIFRRFLPFLGFKYYRLHPHTFRVEDVVSILQKNNFQILDLFITKKIKKNFTSFKEKLEFYLKYNIDRAYILTQK